MGNGRSDRISRVRTSPRWLSAALSEVLCSLQNSSIVYKLVTLIDRAPNWFTDYTFDRTICSESNDDLRTIQKVSDFGIWGYKRYAPVLPWALRDRYRPCSPFMIGEPVNILIVTQWAGYLRAQRLVPRRESEASWREQEAISSTMLIQPNQGSLLVEEYLRATETEDRAAKYPTRHLYSGHSHRLWSMQAGYRHLGVFNVHSFDDGEPSKPAPQSAPHNNASSHRRRCLSRRRIHQEFQ